MKSRLVAVRLERTREVLRELLHSLRGALPILVGVAGPIAIASLALLAWAGVPPMKAVTLPAEQGVPIWLLQMLVAAWPLWALRARLLPEDWCVQLRCLPFEPGALAASDLAVSATVLAPLAGFYAISVVSFALHRTPWFVAAWPAALLSLAGSWSASCALGAAALAWRRRTPRPHDASMRGGKRLDAAPTPLHGLAWSVLWMPWWRSTLNPGGRAIAMAIASAWLLGIAWTRGLWPVVPGAAWALAISALLVAVTERMQRALEAHLEAIEPWLVSLPVVAHWRWQARLLLAVPMTLASVG
ncbi:MAG TPA: hypothetical protein VH328_07110, partial [Burkholderiaceae bacterium]|nr:hypothetical protein [Burkholderiaceae bacterium]